MARQVKTSRTKTIRTKGKAGHPSAALPATKPAMQAPRAKSKSRKAAQPKKDVPAKSLSGKPSVDKRRPVSRSTTQSKRTGRPKQSNTDAEAKRERIMRAALQVFSQHGFEAARLDEVARKAGVAKGTLYLYYPTKQAMFVALVRSAAEPILADMYEIARQKPQSTEELLAKVFALFQREILATDRKLILRLIIAEGPRFPSLARFYHREVVTRVMAMLQMIAGKLDDEGRLASKDLQRYPQLIAAPLLLSVIWDGLFAKIDPLDVEGMLSAHANLMTAARRRARV